jgi:subtilisin
MRNRTAAQRVTAARRAILHLLLTLFILAGLAGELVGVYSQGRVSIRTAGGASPADGARNWLAVIREFEEQAEKMTRSNDAAANFQYLQGKVFQYGVIPVIVRLRAPFKPESLLDGNIEIEVQRQLINRAQMEIIEKIYGHDPVSIKKYESLPYLALRVNPIGLEWLNRSEMVIDIQDDRISTPNLSESVKVIGGEAAWASGYTGRGQTIAIIDTGIDKNHPFLAGKVIAEGCYSTTFSGFGASSVCPGGARSTTAINSGLPCTLENAGCDHGTHVAGIAAGRGNEFSGVARDAWLISIQIFTRFEGYDSCGPGVKECIGAFDSDLLNAMELVYQLRNFHAIAAVNLSLGSGRYSSTCDNSSPAMKDAIDLLWSAGVATITASGNQRYTNAVNTPACISSAISVGSTSKSPEQPGRVSTFSNSSSLIKLLAPGESIVSSVPGAEFKAISGTSMAAPHIAGAWAIARQQSPNASVKSILDALSMTGTRITDTRNNITRPRPQIAAALEYLETILPPNPVPEPPSALTATANSSSQITLKWRDNSDNETGFRIRRRMDSDSDWSIIATLGQGITTFRHSGLRGGMAYQYSVVAFNDAGESGPSNEARGATPSAGPAPPTSLTATVLSESEILLSWQDNSNEETGYRIRRRRGPGGAWSVLTTIGANSTSLRVSGLNTGMMYYFTVSALNQEGESETSNEASAMTGEDPPVPPSGLRAVALSTSLISLRWQDNSTDEVGFRLRRRLGTSGSWQVIANVGPGVTTYEDRGIPPGTTCHYQVLAFNTIGESDFSNEAAATTLADDGVSTPTSPSALIAMAGTKAFVELQWTDNSGDETGFQIWERAGTNGTWTLAAMVGPGTTSFEKGGLMAGQTYFYYVKAYNSAGESARSNETSLMVPKMDFTPLGNGQSLNDALNRSESLYYRIFAPDGVRQLTVETSGDGNIDLYLRHENQPNRTSFNCRSNIKGSKERCTISIPQSGNWHILVQGNYSMATNFRITASYTMK